LAEAESRISNQNTSTWPDWRLRTTAQANDSIGTVTEARADTVDGIADRALAAGLDAASFGTLLPTAADSAAWLAGNTVVTEAFTTDVIGDILGLVRFSTESSEAGFTSALTAHLHFTPTAGADSGTQILLGLLDPVTTGFGSLHFRVDGYRSFRADRILIDENFESVAEAQSFFDDVAINLGDASMGLTGFEFRLEFTGAGAGDAFSTNFLLGTVAPVPLPASVWLLGTGLAVVFCRRR
jgi:hypothetical protein